MQVKVWLESELAASLLEQSAYKQSVEMWRVAHWSNRSRNMPPSLFGKNQHNGDGMRRATGPGSFDTLVESAKREKQAREASQE